MSTTAVNVMKNRLSSIVNVRPFKVINMPDSATALRQLKPFEFQNWVIRKFYGVASPRLSGDMGIDGYSLFERNPIQVKRSDKVGRNVVDNFETAMRRGGHAKGYIAAFSFTSGARAEAARARWQDHLEVQLLTVDELLKPQPKDVIPELGRVETLPLHASRPADAMPSPEELIQSDLTTEVG